MTEVGAGLQDWTWAQWLAGILMLTGESTVCEVAEAVREVTP